MSTSPAGTTDFPVPARIELDRLIGGAHHNPHALLGAHELPDKSEDGRRRTVVRTLRPGATEAVLIATGIRVPMRKIHDGGIFQAVINEAAFDYRLAITWSDGSFGASTVADDGSDGGDDGATTIVDDPYRWLPTVGELDLHLFGEGRHERLWTIQGAHVHTYETPSGEVSGTSFAVWAPNAQGVRVAGDFSGWSGRALPMRSLGSSGLWEIFVPGVGDGALYKFQILGQDGAWREKADPFAYATEKPPATASKVCTSSYEWDDAHWVAQRGETAWHQSPMSIYEVHLGSWRPGLSYLELAEQLVEYMVETGFTHVEFLPVAEHPFGGSWGYQVSSYYAPSARFGSPDEFRYLVDRLHQAGIGVLVDWVPAHFPKDAWSLGRFDGTALYEHPDPRRGEQPDWGTYVFDFGRREVRNFLVANALYWLSEYHIDGLRVDAVASMLYLDYSRPDGQWLPNQYGGRENLEAVSFIQEVNATVYKHHPGTVIIAEESTAWPGVTRPTHLGGLGFGFKWNMGWMHDTLSYIANQPIHRQYHHHQMTFSMMYAYSENFVLPISHDEVVHGKGSLLRKMPGDRWQQLANVRAMLAYMWAHPGKQLLFMGSEFAQEAEWAENHSLDWWLLDNPDHAGVLQLVKDLNKVYTATPALWARDTEPEGFSWIDANDAVGNVLSFVRYAEDSTLACAANFAGVPHEEYRLGLPYAGEWEEIVNTDSTSYCGSGVGNLGTVVATEDPRHGMPASAIVRLPPLGTIWLRRRG